MAWNIGANDVANAMGTSVGSRALTYKRAILVAAVFEFAGAFFVGSHVTATIQGKIIDVEFFTDNTLDLMIGMMSSLLAAGIWLQFATWRGWPNSTTHSILGAIMGFGIASGGIGLIKWDTIWKIIASWIISPIVGGIIAWLVFLVILRGIIRRKDPRKALIQIVPMLLFLMFFVITLSMFFKGLKNLNLEFSNFQIIAISFGIGLIVAIAGRILIPRVVEKGAIGHSRRHVERIFSTLQIMTACYMAFAHGANDVANAIGPLAAVVNVASGSIETLTNTVPPWTLMLGGAGIVIGLATWGYKVMKTVGMSITMISPTRGFAAEFGAATTVLICSKMGLPVSTTHCLVGAVIGIGLSRGINSVNMKVVKEVAVSWLTTVPVSGVVCALLYYLFKWMLT
jgi:PiT family inorganic phosphate transporter